MSVNLDKNRESLVAAWKDVLDDKSATDWALFGYEPQSNDLRVVSTGDGGLLELNEDLNTSNIMYAFVRIQDSKTSLNKYVLINWQGEGAPTVRKGTCANHIRDVSKLLAGAHLTVNARNEDEMEPERILEKVSSVGSAYSFKEPRMQHDEQRGPVGTNYARVIPGKEINSRARDSFWKKEEQEEKHRVELEKERQQAELDKSEKERKIREEKESAERERRMAAAELSSPTKLPTATKPIPQPLTPTQLSPVRTLTQAEEMRQQRNNEAKELIGSRVGTAKAIFNQNSASGQMLINKAAPIKPVRNSIAQRINVLNQSATSAPIATVPEDTTHGEQVEDDTAAPAPSEVASNNTQPISPFPDVVATKTAVSPVAAIGQDKDIVEPEGKPSTAADVVVPQSKVEQPYEDTGDQFSTIKRSPYSKQNSNNSQVTTPVDAEPLYDNIPVTATTATPIDRNSAADTNRGVVIQNDLQSEDDIIYQDIMKEDGLKARALYDYQAADESEITFDPGDLITHIDQIDEGWWQGLGPDGAYGLFPANYVQLI